MKDLFEHYQIDEYGNIFSKTSNTFLSPSKSSGYLKLNLKFNGELKSFSIHRLVAFTYLGLDLMDPTSIVDHINENKLDNHVKNLRVTTKLGNSKAYFGRLDVDSDTHLLCFRCKCIKCIDEFGPSKKTSTGKQSWCYDCVLQYNRARRRGAHRATI